MVRYLLFFRHTATQSNFSSSRPPSEYAAWEEPPQEGEPFDYDAVPNRFYFNVETAGPLPPDVIISEGIKVLQQKLAGLIHELADEGSGANGGPRSPEYGAGAAMDGFNGGYTTPFGNAAGNQSAWGGAGGTTPYGTTPYGAGASWS
jgi:DNA-directed RNA polymerase II subunit RPB3